MTELEELKEELKKALEYRDCLEAEGRTLTSLVYGYKVLDLENRIKHLEQSK